VFRLYGTPDGREVEISEPVVTNVTGAPAAEYRDDPTLPKGVVRQIDFAAGGASVSFTRTVTKDGEVLYDDVFKTNYRPWKAVYLVGTKEE
jgi:vancomycin resistance protein YoaR